MMSGKRTEGMLHSDPRINTIQQGFEIKLGTNRLIKAIRAVEKRNGTHPAHLTQATLARLAQDPKIREELQRRKIMHDELAHSREKRDALKTEFTATNQSFDTHGKKRTLQGIRKNLKLNRKRLRTKRV